MLTHKKGLTIVNKTVAIYVFFDDILKSMNHKEPESRKTTDAEIITVAAAQYLAGSVEKSLCFVRCTDLTPAILGKMTPASNWEASSLANFFLYRPGNKKYEP